MIIAHCNLCKRSTNHDIIMRHEERFGEDQDYLEHYIIRCRGCDFVHYRRDFIYRHGDESDTTIVYYPGEIQRERPIWLGTLAGLELALPNQLQRTLREIYDALHANCPALVTMGIRALLEFIMIEQVSDQGSIGKNVDKFLAAGLVPAKDHRIFRDVLIESGHAAMHRGFVPNREDMDALLDLTEALIASIYVHPKKADTVGTRIPPRTKRPKVTP